MKQKLSLVFLVCLLLYATMPTLYADSTWQQPQHERQFNADFKENYSGRAYNYEGKEKSRSEATQSSSDAANSDDFSLILKSLNWLFILILILAVAYLTYALLKGGNTKLFSSKKRTQSFSTSDISAANILEADIQGLIKKAEDTNDYRLAIRYYYLLVLKQLTLKNYILFEDDKTNADYMSAIAKQVFIKDFTYTSYIYNYTWYGEFSLNVEQYQTAKNRFIQLIKKVKA